jgi:hypothetical protein
MSFRTRPHVLLSSLGVPVAALVVAGILVAPDLICERELQAAPAERPHDPDGDGLDNLVEHVLGTNAFQADTDADGFSDLEELARKSSPLFPQSTPVDQRLRVGMSAYGEGTRLHALIALYLPDGALQTKSFKAGLLIGDRVINLSESYLRSHSQIKIQSARGPNAKVVVLDMPIAPSLVQRYGHLSAFATLGDDAHGVVQAADSIHLIAFGTMIVLQTANPMILGTSSMTQLPPQQGGGSPIGSIYVPLTSGGDTSTWIPGQVCVQQTALVGISGALITQEVVTAECQDGWDGYCPSNCSATIGNTYTTIDPIALIGG